jgi:hypothetical protein
MLAPPAGSLPHPRWAREPLSVPCRPGTPAYKFQVKTKGEACSHARPRAHGLDMNHIARGSSAAAMCPAAPTPTAQPGAAPQPPRVLRPRLPLASPGQLRGSHASSDFGSRCPAQGSSVAATRPLEHGHH